MNQSELDMLLDEFVALSATGQTNSAQLKNKDFSGLSFANRNLANIDLRRSNLTGCNFQNTNLSNACFVLAILDDANFTGADISNTTFDKASMINTDFIGAIWNSVVITAANTTFENRLTNLITNAFTQLGCLQKTKEEWLALTAADRAVLYPDDPIMIEDFWDNVKTAVEES